MGSRLPGHHRPAGRATRCPPKPHDLPPSPPSSALRPFGVLRSMFATAHSLTTSRPPASSAPFSFRAAHHAAAQSNSFPDRRAANGALPKPRAVASRSPSSSSPRRQDRSGNAPCFEGAAAGHAIGFSAVPLPVRLPRRCSNPKNNIAVCLQATPSL